jgi:hypothetical protein
MKLKLLIGKLLPKLGLTLAVLYVVAAGFLFWSMYQKPETFSRVTQPLGASAPFLFFPFETIWKQARADHIQAAPDFTLPILNT